MDVLEIIVNVIDVIESDLAHHFEDDDTKTENIEPHSFSLVKGFFRTDSVHETIVSDEDLL